jgi:dTDP-4-dehydrorhamnose 3,5-epimerase
MVFVRTTLSGAYVVDVEKREDHRGFFARAWCEREFAEHGLHARFAQANVAYNHLRGTLRGMHYQVAPDEEAKLVRCTRGAIYDVIIDLRPSSPTFKEWFGIELVADTYRMLYVPEGCAHGYLTLEDATDVAYQVSAPYAPRSEGGVRYDDPAFGIRWPAEIRVMSEKDRSWPDFRDVAPRTREARRLEPERAE